MKAICEVGSEVDAQGLSYEKLPCGITSAAYDSTRDKVYVLGDGSFKEPGYATEEIDTGFYVGTKEDIVYYPYPGIEELKNMNYEFFRDI